MKNRERYYYLSEVKFPTIIASLGACHLPLFPSLLVLKEGENYTFLFFFPNKPFYDNKFYFINNQVHPFAVIIHSSSGKNMAQPLPMVVLARDFFTLQEERVRQYAKLSASHHEYLNTAPSYDIEAYQKAVTEATKNFKVTQLKICP